MTVHLVGAGCAGPLWITVAASRLLGRAEAVVYDSLIHPDLLQL
ncbi:MAG: uroporphyrinogen-III C-methyltransferase, partial [Synergistaceae bacterium]|nr:uroporphyrinogen-III C-methyltransferase [Synergistaceae bacterium]